MKIARMVTTAIIVAGSGFGLYTAHSRLQSGLDYAIRSGRHAATAASFTTEAFGAPLRETVTVAADKLIPNVPGKRLVAHVVDYPAGASSASHRHSNSAFIYAYVLEGEIRSQVDDEPERIYRAGESWFEKPGARHAVSANVSETRPARLLAVFILDADDEQPTIPDHP